MIYLMQCKLFIILFWYSMYYVLGLKLVQIFLTGYPKTINRPVPGYSIITAYKPNPPVTHHLQCRNDTCQALLRWGGGGCLGMWTSKLLFGHIYMQCVYIHQLHSYIHFDFFILSILENPGQCSYIITILRLAPLQNRM